jgi:hypothetical protein
VKLDLTLYIVLVFFVPGAAVVAALALSNAVILGELLRLYRDPNPVLSLALLSAVFGLGAIADSARAIIVDPLFDSRGPTSERPDQFSQLHGKVSENECANAAGQLEREEPGRAPTSTTNYVRKLTKENLEVLRYLVDHSFEYYRFNANCALAFTLLAVVHLLTRGSDLVFLLISAIALIFCVGARKSHKENSWIMKQFVEGEANNVSGASVY